MFSESLGVVGLCLLSSLNGGLPIRHNKMDVSTLDTYISYRIDLTQNQAFPYDFYDSHEYLTMHYFCFNFYGRDNRDFQYETTIVSQFDAYYSDYVSLIEYAVTHVNTEVLTSYDFILSVYFQDVGDNLELFYVPLFSDMFNLQFASINYNGSLSQYDMYLYNQDEDYSSGHQVNTYERMVDLCFYDAICEPDNDIYTFQYLQTTGVVQYVTETSGNLAFNLTCFRSFDPSSTYGEGYQDGYNAGVEYAHTANSTALTIFTGIIDVGLLPINVFLAMMNFEVFGINIGGLISSLMTVAIAIIIFRVIFNGGSGGGGKS